MLNSASLMKKACFFFFPVGLLVSMNASAKLLFEVLDESPLGLEWRIVNDNVMGGRSRGDFEISEQSLSFFGTTNTNGGGFSSIRSFLDEPVPSESKKMKLLVKGDGRSYTVILREIRSRASFWATFESKNSLWQEVIIPLDSFWPNWRGRRLDYRPIDPSKIREIGLMIYDGNDGPFKFDVKKIEII